MGTMLHDTLDEFFKGITEADRRTRVYLKDPAQAKAGLRAILERRMAGGPFRNEALYRQKMHLESMKSALDSFVDHEAALDAARGLVPTHFEIGFGKKVKGELEYLRIAGGKEPVLIGGKIDRIDISADGKSALIIDYKRSQRNLLKKIEEGLELQLPIYMLAAKRLLGLRVMGAEHRILTKPGKQGVYLEEFSELLDAGEKQVRTEMQMDAYLAGIETAIAAIADRIRSADISVKSRSCDYCEYDPVCRFEKWKLVYEKN